MAQSQGQGEGLKRRIKQILGLKKTTGIGSGNFEDKDQGGIIFTTDVLKEISNENSAVYRGRVLKELCEVVAKKKLESHTVETLWRTVEDLLTPTTPIDVRHIVLKFLAFLASGQYERLGILRAQYFRFIATHTITEDLGHRINLLQVITNGGKDMSYGEHVGTFVLSFMAEALGSDKVEDFLLMLNNMVRYNSSFLDEDVVAGIVQITCEFCSSAEDEKEIENFLQLLDATVRYGGLPMVALKPLILTLCQTVNVEPCSMSSWKLMRNLVGTHFGYNAIHIMCNTLEDCENVSNPILLRGAVFFVGMCIWGSKRVSSLRHKPISVLPSIRQGLHCDHPVVAHEVALSLQRLVKKYGKDLEVVTWDLILDIIEHLLKFQMGLSEKNDPLSTSIAMLITCVEDLYIQKRFSGAAEELFSIVEKYSDVRPPESVLCLLTYSNGKINPSHSRWIERMQHIVEKYYRLETRTAIRVKVLDMVSTAFFSFRYWYEDELLESIVIPVLTGIEQEESLELRLVATQLLVDLINICSSPKCCDILGILEKLINRVAENSESGTWSKEAGEQEENFSDTKVAVVGLIEAFKKKLYQSPANQAVMIFTILSHHLLTHYVHGFITSLAASIRKEVFKLFLSIRADEKYHLGTHEESTTEGERLDHSVFVSCVPANFDNDAVSQLSHQPARTPFTVTCPVQKAFEAILACLKDEWDWTVLEFVLTHLRTMLRNKTLVLGANADMTTLCVLLSKMINDRMFLNKVRQLPSSVSRSEFHNLVFPVLAVLATYHKVIEKSKQFELVKCLEVGIGSQCAKVCVKSLTISTLELPSVMVRALPSILVKLSQTSATVVMAVPMLEFLSSLKEVPPLYSNFVEEQYMSIFAIALPYTDAFRYSQYIVTLAHHVITSWFTRCRLPYRKAFVRLITKGLKSSSIISSDRHRSNSVESRFSGDTKYRQTKEFHEEMTETCLDMMARYSFSSCSSQPKRTPAMDFLLANGDSQSWLIGNVLITITTSSSDPDSCPACSLAKTRLPHTAAPGHGTTAEPQYDHMSSTNKSSPATKRRQQYSEPSTTVESPGGRHTQTSLDSSEGGLDSSSRFAVEGGRLTAMTPSPGYPLRHNDVFVSGCAATGEPSLPLLDRLSLQAKLSGAAESSFSPSQQMLFSRQSSVGEPSAGGMLHQTHCASTERALSPTLSGDMVVPPKSPGLAPSRQAVVPLTGVTKPTNQLVAVVKPSSCQRQDQMEGTPTSVAASSQGRYDTSTSAASVDVTWRADTSSRRPLVHVTNPSNMPLCRCCLEGWAEIVIRRPSGNTSWIMRLENMPTRSDYNAIVDDIVALCSTYDNTRKHEEAGSDTPGTTNSAPVDATTSNKLTVSIPGSDPIKMRRIARSGPTSPTTSAVRRRFSTGSLEIPCDLSITSTSPDMDTVQEAYNKLQQELEFNRPLVGLSPLSTTPASTIPSTIANDVLATDEHVTLPAAATKKPCSAPATPVAAERTPAAPATSLAPATGTTAETSSGKATHLSPRRSRASRQLAFVNRKSWHSSDSENAKDAERLVAKQDDVPVQRAGVEMLESMPSSLGTTEAHRKRGQTISIPLRSTPSGRDYNQRMLPADSPSALRSLVNPSFVFLQLFYSSFLSGSALRPILLDSGEVVDRAVKVLDRIPPFDTHKIGVLYVGPHQASDESAILSNQYGSSRYVRFLADLGSLIKLTECSRTEVYTGGLDRNGIDGDFAYSWRDDSTQVIFHTATLMPNRASDPACNSKKLHIGNNFVTVVYNDSGDDYSFGTIKGQFNFAEIVITPLDCTSSVVVVRVKSDVGADAIDTTPHVISDDGLALLVRQMAIHTNMATVLEHSRKRPGNAYGCNRLERLRQLKKIQSKSLMDKQGPCSPSVVTPSAKSGAGGMFPHDSDELHYVDFTEFT